ncbi:nicotinate phosphoribosyltransferase [Agrobacterium vitis]|nr:nicotinate phosphoribosyltransferase [Agrobacterium vitis]MCM2449611.1 nicotinate phosphoribosyltransferase [Agrobacterium vitis]MCM2467108.1 nicotinate phosphoribosyltransferase [Agrobacterium vitis]MUO71830.1 nicotinate phosphoribosyltransferase [Agrobacterium vitis]MUO85832.1 nicotinate phosphoribosyltransferase [Agrobacterium vitis]
MPVSLMSRINLILNTDSYKLGHFLQYPPGTRAVSGYVTTRGASLRPEVVFFGLQMFLKEYLSQPITQADIDEAQELAALHGQPFDQAGWHYILSAHGGFLPLRIEALPEGSFLHRGVPMVQVVNTDPACFWLPSYIETALLRAVWYPSTVASSLRHVKQTLKPFLDKSCDDPAGVIGSRLFEYGARGAASLEQAGLGGVANLLHFDHTDTLEAVLYARRYYGAEMAGLSIPASEHTTMIAWGQDQEVQSFANMIDRFGDYPAYSVVSDSYDIHNAVSEIWGKTLQQKVRSKPGRLIVRPDSGDPIDVPVQTVAQLAYQFGTRLNAKGYKVLDDKVRVLQADGVSLRDITMILGRLEAMGFSAENISFGIGASQLQKVSRSTYSFTMKCSAIMDGQERWRPISRRPVTMQERMPEPGRRAVVVEGDEFASIALEDLGRRTNHLQPVWENGRLLKEWSFDDIKAKARTPHRMDM